MYHWPSGAKYEGEVLRGMRHGKGRQSFADSPVVYEGDWHNGMRHGVGTITLDEAGSHWYKGVDVWAWGGSCLGHGISSHGHACRWVSHKQTVAWLRCALLCVAVCSVCCVLFASVHTSLWNMCMWPAPVHQSTRPCSLHGYASQHSGMRACHACNLPHLQASTVPYGTHSIHSVHLQASGPMT